MLNILKEFTNIFPIDTIFRTNLITSNFWNEAHFYAKDKEGQYIIGNNSLAKTVGFKNGNEIYGLTDKDICTPSVASILHLNDKRVIRERTPVMYKEEIHTKSGNQFTIMSYKFPLSLLSKKYVGIIGFSFIIKIHGGKFPYFNEEHEICNFQKNAYHFSKRQLDILRILVRGKSSKEIAKILNLSPRTVEHYIDAIKIKLQVSKRSELIDKIFDYFV